VTSLNDEAWLTRRLREQTGADAFQGTTDVSIRKDRIRQAIADHGLRSVVIGSHQGKPETWASIFERLYGEPL
jgi:hypothetical protein